MPKAPRDYLLTEGETRALFILGGVGAVAVLVLILVLISARPQAHYTAADTTEYEQTLATAAAAIGDYSRNETTGRVTIPIERAMALVAERGVTDLSFGNAAGGAVLGADPVAPSATVDDAATSPTNITPEVEPPTGGAREDANPATEAVTVADVNGEGIYLTNCSSCHQNSGEGVAGAFPPLVAHAPAVYNAEGGREYLIRLLLHGLVGPIEVNGQGYNGVMLAWQQLGDDQIAAVLNYTLTSWGNEALLENFEPYTAEDVEPYRGETLSSEDVYELRQTLNIQDQQ